jgi:thymidylate synthase (FAD)
MTVKLVGVTRPIDEFGDSASDVVAYCARVSNPNNQSNFGTGSKLLSYMIREGHWSPFEMVHITMEIETTRDIARQILRHRSFAFQEFSQRYAKVKTFSLREARLQDHKNRQNSVKTNDENLLQWWYKVQTTIQEKSDKYYQQALFKGIAKEQARALLPEGLTESRLYMAGSLRSWIHYCQLEWAMERSESIRNCKRMLENFTETEFPEVIAAVEQLCET